MATTFSIESLGKTPADCIQTVRLVNDSRESQADLFAWKETLRSTGAAVEGDALERLVLNYAVQESRDGIESLRVHPGVKTLMQKEFQAYSKPPGSGPQLLAGTDPFVTACKIASLRRFVAGPFDWVVSGFPRSWLSRIPFGEIPKAFLYITAQFGGFKPAFYVHLAPAPRNRALIIPKEVRKAYYRMAKSLELQPEMKGILCSSWFHDPAVFRDAPHLAPLNEPYLEHGGRIVTTLGPAPADSGFLDHNPERRKMYENGQFRPQLGLAMWPRADAIQWANQHSDLEK